MPHKDWNPAAYQKFTDLRLLPALDLLAAVGDLPAGGLVDLGCGTGVAGPALAGRYPDRDLIGMDSSPAMLEQAQAQGVYDRLDLADAATWAPEASLAPVALIFSNAVLQWLPDHAALLTRLVGLLPPAGVLAVQVPHQQQAPSGRGWRTAFATVCGGQPAEKVSEVLEPEGYFDLLQPLGDLRLWETEYFQHLPAAEQGHPVRIFTESTYGRPYLQAADTRRDALLAEYDRLMRRDYPTRPDGSVLFPFRRLFFILRRGDRA